ncbi:MAG: aldo/keto reductase [Actinomycetota bacterium]|nr:aldo/keto reductase [Geodermatophilaceae bacterium]MDQ3504669.1 aldo/keto reductase [Actinomycetota bacterium]
MEQRQITRLSVPVVGMGTSGTLDLPDKDQPLATLVIEAALDAGSTLIDSSPMYGRAEAVSGRALADRRAEALIATKVWTEDDDEAERQIEASLSYFGGHVELFQVHNLLAWRTRLDQLQARRDAGQLTLIGATHWKPAAFEELEKVMRTGRLDAIQIPYNPVEREVEARILPLADELGLGVLVMRPFGGGELAGRRVRDADLRPLAEFGITSWPGALLAWGLSDARISCAIPATSKPERARANAAAGTGPWLDADARRLVQRIATGSDG